jgi:hypothetical protein
MIKNDLSETISLEGKWDFKLGEGSSWGKIEIPSCWEAAGYSKFIDGPALFRRMVSIPEQWEGKTILAEFEAVSYACVLSVNGLAAGKHRGMWTPFSIDITSTVRPGEENTLEMKVFKPGERYPMRSTLAGFIPDVSTTFGGIWQPARLRAVDIGLKDLFIEPRMDTQDLNISCEAVLFSDHIAPDSWEIIVTQDGIKVAAQSTSFSEGEELQVLLKISDPTLWSPGNPSLYNVQVRLLADENCVAQTNNRVGFRRLSADGDQLVLNDQPIQVRGILSWGWEPDLIAPAYTDDMARAEMRSVREMGFNLIKLCLFIPNQTYYQVADEEGMLLWQEWPLWQPEITPQLREDLPGEYSEFTHLTRNHPSVVLYSLGCELNQDVDEQLMGEMNSAVRSLAGEVLLCDNSGSGESYEGLDRDFSDFSDYHPYYDLHYLEPLLNNWRRDWQSARPLIFGEFCDSDTFRDVNEIIQAHDDQRPWWMTSENPITTWRPESYAMLEAQERLEQHQLSFSALELKQISYAQSLLERKFTLELLRRRSGIGGYVVTGLRDTPISTSGIWDDLAQSKWPPSEFCKVNAEAVLCLDVNRRRRWQNRGDRPDILDVYNHWSGAAVRWYVILNASSNPPVPGCELNWTLKSSTGDMHDGGFFLIDETVIPGVPSELGVISCQLPRVDQPTELQLAVELSGNGFSIKNNWDVYVYPRSLDLPPNLAVLDPASMMDEWGVWVNHLPRIRGPEDSSIPGIILSTVWNEHLEDYVTNSGKVILLQHGDGPIPARRCPFWRESVLLFPEHELWETFPHRGYAGYQFFGIASDRAFISQEIQKSISSEVLSLNPIMRRLDAREFHISDYLFEARIGKGVLLGCTLRLVGGMGAQPFGFDRNVAGGSLLRSLIDYVNNL